MQSLLYPGYPVELEKKQKIFIIHFLSCCQIGGSDGGGGGGVVHVVGLSTGRTVRRGSATCPAPVTALAFDTQGSTLWAGDEKVRLGQVWLGYVN